jgi:glycopeptide antibiotics resistance protein
MKKENKKEYFALTKMLFIIYCILLIWIILFKTSFSISEFIALSGKRSINLIPFHYPTEVNFHLREVIANVLIFVPLGIYLKILDINSKKVILYGLIFSILLEISQFIFKIGATDITDVITNVGGTIIGVFGYFILEKVFKNKEKINKVLRTIALIFTIFFSLLIILLIISN